jgi:hypothetical protein
VSELVGCLVAEGVGVTIVAAAIIENYLKGRRSA